MKTQSQLNEEAVSPVIGVILMVAITVVLAAVVFVLVSDLGGDIQDPPKVSWTTDRAGDGGTITVVKIDNGPIDWDNVQVTGPGTCTITTANATVVTDAGGGNGTEPDMGAGDRVSCDTDGTLTIVEASTDTLLYSDSL